MTRPVQVAKCQMKIGGMSCSFCTESIRKAYRRMDGVIDVSVSLSHEEALVRYDPEKLSEEQIKDTLRSLGYTVRDPRKVRTFEEEETELRRERSRLLVALGFTTAALGFMALMWVGLQPPWFRWPMWTLALATVFGAGWPILRMAFQSARRLILNQHVLLELGAFGGLVGGLVGLFHRPWPTADFLTVAVFITTYHLLSGYASLFVRTRSSQAVGRLLTLQPPLARVIEDGREREVPIEEVQAGMLVRVRPGEQMPVDGMVVEGASGVDESLVTGESIPREKNPGDQVIGGSLNQSGTLVVQVTRVGEESFLQQVARHIQEARALKPSIIQLVDNVLKYYVPAVIAFAGAGFVLWTLAAWPIAGEPQLSRALFAVLAVLVMGYPCALGMATPLAMIRGGGLAARKGILLRSGEAFQVFKDVRKIVLDKTGTITRGQPAVVEIVPLGESDAQEMLVTAASAENPSEHPLARSIVERAHDDGLALVPVADFQAVAGQGVQARVDGASVLAGKLAFLEAEGIDLGQATGRIEELECRGNTVVAVARDGRVLGLIAIADTIKEDAREAIARLREAGLEPVMVTGDNRHTAEAVAAQVGIEEVMAEVLPDQKAQAVRELQRQGYRVAMVGDGINDAPALMQADVGIAIAAGTDIAIESSDIVLVGDRLGSVLDAYHIGRNSYRKTVQNVALAFAFNSIGVPAAVTGLVHPVWAMVAMAGSVSLVLLNSFGGRLIPRMRERILPVPGPVHEVTLRVPSIHCHKCLAGIRDALEKVPSVETVSGDVGTKIVAVTYRDGAATEGELRERIASLGHTVS